MATLMNMHWPEVTPEHYEKARAAVRWEEDPPEGARFHVAWMAEDGFHVLDFWESREDFERFAQERLMPGLAPLGFPGQPIITFREPIGVFSPDIESISV